MVQIELRKISNQDHQLTLIRADGSRETARCETRSTLVHDLLHYAVEREAGVQTGFWGTLAAGRTLADMNDRTGVALGTTAPEVMAIERIVGPLTGATKGAAPEALAARVRAYLAETGTAAPDWLTPAFIAAVQERLRHLLGAWRALGFGDPLRLGW